MINPQTKAKAYRDLAIELRAIVERDGQAVTNEMLIKVAQDYDRMAENMDAIAVSQALLKKPRISH